MQNQNQPGTAIKTPRAEMWWIILAKSKIMRFFSVSCELILFLGCLWLTMTTILPSAASIFNGGLDNFFLVAMGFAVDAAMPEAWLHVVDQWTDTPRKKMHLRWSVSIAIGMSLLVVANVTYTKIAGTSGVQPTGGLETFINILLITRILIGISYVAIRECQSFLDRKTNKQAASVPSVDVPQMITDALSTFAAQFRIDQAQALKGQINTLKSELAAMETANIQADIQAITDRLMVDFQAKFQAIDQALFRQNVTISEVTTQAKRLPEKAGNVQATQAVPRDFRQSDSGKFQAKKQPEQNATAIIRLVPASASRDELIAEAKRLHDVEGLSTYAIGERIGKSAKTVQSWLSSGRNQAEEEAM